MQNSVRSTIDLDPSLKSAFGTLETNELTPVLQGDFTYGINNQFWNYSYIFTITAPATYPVNGSIYSNNNASFICLSASGTTATFQGGPPPSASGTLTNVSGTGSATITFSAFSQQAGVIYGAGAMVDTNLNRLRVQSGTASGNFAYVSSKKIIRYRAGQGTTVRFTPVFTSGVTNSLQLIGVGTISNNAPYDGFFIGYSGASFGISYYNSGVLTWIPQGSWNGFLNISSPLQYFNWSGIYGVPVMIKYPYLGYGDITFYVQNPINANWVLFHTIQYGYTSTFTELSNPSLQFIALASSSGVITNMTCYVGSVGMFISGQRNFLSGPKQGIDNSKNGISTETCILNLQNCVYYNGVPNHGMVRLTSVGLALGNTSNNNVSFLRLKINPVIGGTPSWTAINGTLSNGGLTIASGSSIMSYDVVGTTVSGGIWSHSIPVGQAGNQVIDLTPFEIFLSPGDVLSITGNATVPSIIGVSCNWVEDI